MVARLFISFFEVSIATGYVILFLVLLRALLIKRLPRIAFHLMWVVVLIRLLIPVTIRSPLSILNVTGIHHLVQDSAKDLIYAGSKPVNVQLSMTEVILPRTDLVFGDKVSLHLLSPSEALGTSNYLSYTSRSLTIYSLLWLVVTLVFTGLMIYLFLQARRRLDTATLIHDYQGPLRLYESDQITSPMVVGILYPKVVLPLSLTLSMKERQVILCHEACHLRHLDHMTKPLALLALCLHWYNPAVWLFYLYFLRDMEVACDQSVLGQEDQVDPAHYADVLLKVAQRTQPLFSGGLLAFGERDISLRLKGIIKHKSLTKRAMVLGFMFAVTTTVITAGVEDDHTRLMKTYVNHNTMINESIEANKEDILAIIYVGDTANVIHWAKDTKAHDLLLCRTTLTRSPLFGWRPNGGSHGSWSWYQSNLGHHESSAGYGGNSSSVFILKGIYRGHDVTALEIKKDNGTYLDTDIHLIHLIDDYYMWYTTMPFGTRVKLDITYLDKDSRPLFYDDIK